MTIRDTLLISIPKAMDLFQTIKEMSFQIGIGIFFVSILFEFFYQMDFLGVLKRMFIAIASIVFFQTFLTSAADIGLTFADAIITPNNNVLKEWRDARDSFQKEISDRTKDTVERYNAGDKSLSASSIIRGNSYEKLKKSIGDDLLMWFIYFLAKISLYFVSFTYTLSYYLTLLLFPLIAMVSIFPLTKEAHHSSFLTCIWLGVTPVVVAIILNICDLLNNPTNIAANLMSRFIFSVIMAFYLIRSFSIAKQAVAGSGIAGAAAKMSEGLSNSVVMSVLTTGMSRITRPLNTIVRSIANTIGSSIPNSRGGGSLGNSSFQSRSFNGQGNNLYSGNNSFENKLEQLSNQKSNRYNSPTANRNFATSNDHPQSSNYNPPRQVDPNERMINLSEMASNDRGQSHSSVSENGSTHSNYSGENFYSRRSSSPSSGFNDGQHNSRPEVNHPNNSNNIKVQYSNDRAGSELYHKRDQAPAYTNKNTNKNLNTNRSRDLKSSTPDSKIAERKTTMRDNKRG